MPEQPEGQEPTETEIDMVVEEVTGKPLRPANLAVGITSMKQRITQLEADKIKLLDSVDEDSDGRLKNHLAAVNKDLEIARERLAHYEAQVGKQN